MNLEDLIPTEEICMRYKVEQTFISSLSQSGLIKIVTVEKSQYVPTDEIAAFEKLRRLHYELNINLEGLEAIQHLLAQLEELQLQNRKLKNRLGLYE
ncbi:chaperone modulator CbpM [Salegentibacter sediminis]|uniref:chaperone modulator CbpM n=1 Tax=Salegentibacter sediminis TaxID=1930251 RepID=UPI0009C02603|nr:chaperone modulator CbpM [Salegentibacter sediminis]